MTVPNAKVKSAFIKHLREVNTPISFNENGNTFTPRYYRAFINCLIFCMNCNRIHELKHGDPRNN